MDILMNLMMPVLHPELLPLIAIGVFLGIYIGAIPGLSVTMAVSILISFTFSWDVLPAIALMIGINVGGVYGGSRSAILLNIPGAPAAVATGFDGYPLAQKGQAGRALGITVVQSFVGGIIGTIVLAVLAPIISNVALQVAPRDYVLLGVMGLLLVGTIGSKSASRGIFSVSFGLFLGMVGLDFATGQQRFTFGSLSLMNGVDYVSAMIGLFGMSEAFVQLKYLEKKVVKQKTEKIRPKKADIFKYLPLAIKSSLFGSVIGALPGTGGDMAALFAYGFTKKTVKNPDVPFGEGAMEGLVAPESANNAAIGGAYIPMLTLGIPGDAVTAVIIGALAVHGINAGPTLITDKPDVFWLIVGGMFFANIFLLIFGFSGIRLFSKIVEIPREILMPVIMVLSIVGAYSINNNISDVYWMLGFGVVGYIFKEYEIPVAPMILGIILSKTIEQNFRRAILLTRSNPVLLIKDIFTNPITCIIFLVLIIILLSQMNVFEKLKKRKEGGQRE